jgi:hypothetical protein
MIQLNGILHDTNFAHIAITRVGDTRNTQYQIQQSEADKKADGAFEQLRRENTLSLINYDSEAAVASSDFLRRKYGKHDSDQTQE